ncbi:hypothetical protein [Paraburkholderia tropica]|uniref:hypothetical protein n=1 Tax=Paraburkholderia tropica TaxID=92647 RepID=UPI0015917AE7|nr:hypothetical protein [Paraburkholderia tropica]
MPKATPVITMDLDGFRDDLGATLDVLGYLDSIFACIEDLSATDSPAARHRIARLASLGSFTAEGWCASIGGMMANLLEGANGTEGHLVTAQAFAGSRAAEQSRESAHA